MALVNCIECGGRVSDQALACPHCGKPLRANPLYGREYRSEASLFGLPLLHIATGIDATTGRKRVAKGIIAIGDVAVGVLAVGGGAFGGIAVGGCALGLLSLGGVSLGLLLAIGGCAIGGIALGGLAVGGVALGGMAIGHYAMGGGAWGPHTLSSYGQDPEALDFFRDWLGPWVDTWGRGRP
jgi:hypothetical protein